MTIKSNFLAMYVLEDRVTFRVCGEAFMRIIEVEPVLRVL